MTIGAYDYDVTLGPNPDFLVVSCFKILWTATSFCISFYFTQKLVECHKEVCNTLGIAPETFELSMGMSSDYQHAVNISIILLYF
jgi:hypothetical protein